MKNIIFYIVTLSISFTFFVGGLRISVSLQDTNPQESDNFTIFSSIMFCGIIISAAAISIIQHLEDISEKIDEKKQ